MAEGVKIIAKGPEIAPITVALVPAAKIARETPLRIAPNGIRYAAFGDTTVAPAELDRMVQAVPSVIAAGLAHKAWYFVPLALADAPPEGNRSGHEETLIAPAYSTELADQAICHRNVTLDVVLLEEAVVVLEETVVLLEGAAAVLPEAPGSTSAAFPSANDAPAPTEGVFISTRLLGDRFSLAFEFFINAAHAFADQAGVPETFSELAWSQAVADVRGETSQDAWEARAQALNPASAAHSGSPVAAPSFPATLAASLASSTGKPRIDEKARSEFLEAAFSDAIAIYMLSLSVDFDYSELREREYPLLAPQPLAERLRLAERLFPPNPDYEFAIRYRRRA